METQIGDETMRYQLEYRNSATGAVRKTSFQAGSKASADRLTAEMKRRGTAGPWEPVWVDTLAGNQEAQALHDAMIALGRAWNAARALGASIVYLDYLQNLERQVKDIYKQASAE